MRRFVQPRRRTLSRRIIVRTESKKTSQAILFLYYHRQKIIGLWILLLLIYLIFIRNRSPIQHVTFSQETYQTYEYEPILTTVSQELIGKWYYKQKYRKRSSMIATIRKQFPIVKNIRPISFSEWTLTVDIQFNNPDFIAQTSDNTSRIVYHNTLLPVTENTTLWSSWLTIWITAPTDVLTSYSWWVFWKIGSLDLVKIIHQITFLPKEWVQIIYYPWREKLKITANNGTFIISLDQALLPLTLEKWENIIPYMPVSDPYSADISDPHRIIIKQ